MKTVKQTAGNNKFLAGVKRRMNHLIYKRTKDIVNAEGVEAGLTYLRSFVMEEYRHEYTIEHYESFAGGKFNESRQAETIQRSNPAVLHADIRGRRSGKA